MTAMPKGEKKPTARAAREPVKFTVTLLPMTEKQTIQMYRNLVQAGERIRAEQEANHAAD